MQSPQGNFVLKLDSSVDPVSPHTTVESDAAVYDQGGQVESQVMPLQIEQGYAPEQPVAAMYVASPMVDPRQAGAAAETPPWKRLLSMVLMLYVTVIVALVFGYLYLRSTGEDVTQDVLAMFGSQVSSNVFVADETPRRVRRVEQRIKRNRVVARTRSVGVGEVPPNPYWDLPNILPEFDSTNAKVWSTGAEAIWRNGVAHRYNYQRYKTLREVRRMRLAGSEEILKIALREKKLWLRMKCCYGFGRVWRAG